VAHLLGNMTIFIGADGINAYAAKLHELTPVVWLSRIVMGAALLTHAFLAVVMTLENRAASPTRYAVSRSLKATFAGKTMIWTGLLLGGFLVYHLLHFTVRVTPGLVLGSDARNRFDVFTMVFESFRTAPIAAVYVLGMVALFLHLSHGIHSLFHSYGLHNPSTLPRLEVGGRLVSGLFLVGFGAIPVCILVGLLAR
jgi:succinate dehydrogenase / fumarate reductase, cytochrome b subunit